jgi:hypothetical protein
MSVSLCSYCGHRMDGSSCLPRIHQLGEVAKEVEPYGSEEWWAEAPPVEPAPNCHDCAVVLGGYHHLGCDLERCPLDGSQAASGDCQVEPA